MRNAIDTSHFEFSEEIRKKKRQELCIVGKYAIGCVGRLEKQKNQEFLLRAYALIEQKRQDTCLILIGRGNDELKLKKLAHELNIEASVRFLGIRNDVPELLNALDVFALPSLYEGLPVVLIEAQANGLPVVASDRITNEVDITDLISYLPISGDENVWAEKISDFNLDVANRKKYSGIIRKTGYDINQESKKMENFYCG